jgi:predicted nuclease of predicted toxin-antitoxin system
MAGRGIALFTDELVDPALAVALRAQGYDAVSCQDVGRINQRISDHDQLAYAAATNRAILTNNARDFIPLDAQWNQQGQAHAGIIIYAGVPSCAALLRRVVRHLDAVSPET